MAEQQRVVDRPGAEKDISTQKDALPVSPAPTLSFGNNLRRYATGGLAGVLALVQFSSASRLLAEDVKGDPQAAGPAKAGALPFSSPLAEAEFYRAREFDQRLANSVAEWAKDAQGLPSSGKLEIKSTGKGLKLGGGGYNVGPERGKAAKPAGARGSRTVTIGPEPRDQAIAEAQAVDPQAYGRVISKEREIGDLLEIQDVHSKGAVAAEKEEVGHELKMNRAFNRGEEKTAKVIAEAPGQFARDSIREQRSWNRMKERDRREQWENAPSMFRLGGVYDARDVHANGLVKAGTEPKQVTIRGRDLLPWNWFGKKDK